MEVTKKVIDAVKNSSSDVVQGLLTFLDAETTLRFLETFQGEVITVPKPDKFYNAQRNIDIATEFYNGTTINKLSKKYMLSSRSIRTIINNTKL